MIHPSYKELIEAINEGHEEDETPLVTSRYSVVLATSKRARQLIAGAEPLVRTRSSKALSVAVDEIYKGKVNILPNDEEDEAAEGESGEAAETAEGADAAKAEAEEAATDAAAEQTAEAEAE
jgi:DNA-directed RNA polymerase subunit omega